MDGKREREISTAFTCRVRDTAPCIVNPTAFGHLHDSSSWPISRNLLGFLPIESIRPSPDKIKLLNPQYWPSIVKVPVLVTKYSLTATSFPLSLPYPDSFIPPNGDSAADWLPMTRLVFGSFFSSFV